MFIMPLKNTNGTPDIGSIISHVTLLEQKVSTLDTKDHDRELMVTTLKTQVANSQQKIRDLEVGPKTQETSCNDKIHQLETKLNNAEIAIAVLKPVTGSKAQPTQTPPDIAKLKTDVENLKKDVPGLQFNLSMSGGGMSKVSTILSEIAGIKQNFSTLQDAKISRTTYVRWGRTDCPAGNDVVYKAILTGDGAFACLAELDLGYQMEASTDITVECTTRGYMGGKHYHETGSGTNYLCLPDNPVYGPHHSLTRGRIYGVEYYADPTSTVQN